MHRPVIADGWGGEGEKTGAIVCLALVTLLLLLLLLILLLQLPLILVTTASTPCHLALQAAYIFLSCFNCSASTSVAILSTSSKLLLNALSAQCTGEPSGWAGIIVLPTLPSAAFTPNSWVTAEGGEGQWWWWGLHCYKGGGRFWHYCEGVWVSPWWHPSVKGLTLATAKSINNIDPVRSIQVKSVSSKWNISELWHCVMWIFLGISKSTLLLRDYMIIGTYFGYTLI